MCGMNSNSSSSNNNNKNICFFLIWRNHYIRSLIRGFTLCDSDIRVSLGYLERNGKQLELLKINNNENVFNINIATQKMNLKYFNLLLESNYIHLINELDFKQRAILDPIQVIMIPNTISKLSIYWGENLIDTSLSILPRGLSHLLFYQLTRPIEKGDLPDKLTSLVIKKSKSNILPNNEYLPSTLTSLEIPYISSTTPLPETLTSLTWSVFSVRPIAAGVINKSLKILKSSNAQGELMYVNGVEMPKDIKLDHCHYCPQTFDDLVDSITRFHTMRWITGLDLMDFGGGTIIPGSIPPYIKYLSIPFKSVPHGAFPEGLETLKAHFLDIPIEEEGFFPSSLLHLDISSFKQVLRKGLLPSKLVSLSIAQFKYPENYQFIQDIIPKTLTSLRMYSHSITGASSFAPISIGSSASNMLESINKPFLPALLIPPSVTQLELDLHKYGMLGLPNAKNILDVSEFKIPPSIKKFIIRGTAKVVAGGFIPSTVECVEVHGRISVKPGFLVDGCKYLTIDNRGSVNVLERDDIPQSVTHLKIHYNPHDYIPRHIKVLDMTNKPKKKLIDTKVLQHLNTLKRKGVLYDFKMGIFN
ncbi:hypothetical protein CYY_001594 [Polysphondylium violaceum]|uniref:FNIP repeat-containing protein n=1 Tax=Polysphondylium violaceum TaxID=133409 RepID=A0A8J4V1H8_9MYCE|nr:hypothetical protein CYY_001594 [Polysphondylium violaceum]